MRELIGIAIISLLLSCGVPPTAHMVDRYIIETEVQLLEGKTDEVLALFKSTNPELVSGESDWIRASFSAVEGADIIIVRAEWKSKASYTKFSSSARFKEIMGEFGKYFKAKPEVTITKVLFEM
jgi:quinol monooxygenase YgiN